MFTKKFQKKMGDIQDNIQHLNEMEDALKKLNSIIDIIGVTPQSSAPKQKQQYFYHSLFYFSLQLSLYSSLYFNKFFFFFKFYKLIFYK